MNPPTRVGPPPDSRAVAFEDGAALRALFEQALAQPEGEREAWTLALRVDEALRSKLRRLLRAAANTHGPLDVPALEHAARIGEEDEPPAPAGLIGERVGAFRLTALLGQGGMATVFLGEREGADFHHKVAVKLLRRGLYSELEQRLFRRERQALASLSHPNIAHLIDGGITASGIPYLAIEFVDGGAAQAWRPDQPLAVPFGTSSDLMLAEDVLAIGNAFGGGLRTCERTRERSGSSGVERFAGQDLEQDRVGVGGGLEGGRQRRYFGSAAPVR